MIAGLEAEDGAPPLTFNANIQQPHPDDGDAERHKMESYYEYDSEGIGTNELCASPAHRGDGRRIILSPFV
jgi:hypothetical protein